jgi:mRNA interferase RelE/StbE
MPAVPRRYRIVLARSACKQLAALPRDVQQQVGPQIALLADDPRPHGSQKLKGSDLYRIRVGDYRVVYAIDDDDLLIGIVRVAHRRDAYRP